MMPKELYHKKPVKRPLTMAQPARILKQLRLLLNCVLFLLCIKKFFLYPWALQEFESIYSNNLGFLLILYCRNNKKDSFSIWALSHRNQNA